jgi:hypothetical protein
MEDLCRLDVSVGGMVVDGFEVFRLHCVPSDVVILAQNALIKILDKQLTLCFTCVMEWGLFLSTGWLSWGKGGQEHAPKGINQEKYSEGLD